MTKDGDKYPDLDGLSDDCWTLGKGFTVETCLTELYDRTAQEPVPSEWTELLRKLA